MLRGFAAFDGHDEHVAKTARAVIQERDPFIIGRKCRGLRRAQRRPLKRAGGEQALFFGGDVESAQLVIAADEGERLAVRRKLGKRIARCIVRELGLLIFREIKFENVRRAFAIGYVDNFFAIGRPDHVGFVVGSVGDTHRVAAIFCRRRKNLSVRGEDNLLAIGRKREPAEIA